MLFARLRNGQNDGDNESHMVSVVRKINVGTLPTPPTHLLVAYQTLYLSRRALPNPLRSTPLLPLTYLLVHYQHATPLHSPWTHSGTR